MDSKIEHIFVDIDGVLADFTSAALAVHDRAEIMATWPAGERDIPKVLGLSRTKYWKGIDGLGCEFWSELVPYPWFKELISLIESFGPFSLLTAPALAPHCLEGKVMWIYKNFPRENGRLFGDFLIGREKHLLASPRRILIDDAEHNADQFTKHGGHSILFPQIWNRNHAVEDRLEFVESQLKQFAGLID